MQNFGVFKFFMMFGVIPSQCFVNNGYRSKSALYHNFIYQWQTKTSTLYPIFQEWDDEQPLPPTAFCESGYNICHIHLW